MHVEKGRVGKFFFVLGLFLLVIFFSVDRSLPPQFEFFLGGTTFLCLGIFLMWRGYKPSPTSDRFRSWRKMQERSREKKESKAKKGS
jgi:hypothetical protein